MAPTSLPQTLNTALDLFKIIKINTWDVYFINFGCFINVHNFNKDNIVWQLQDTYCNFVAPARERYHQQEMIKLVFPARSCNILYNLRIPIAILINFNIL